MNETRRALISVSNKDGVVEFARALVERGYEIISTGGTMAALHDAGVAVKAVSEATGVPEILGGRIKTLHPMIFGGILAQRQLGEDMCTLDELGIAAIDIVAVNLYPFEQTIEREGVGEVEAIEKIDIGGPSLLRAAAKNFHDVYAVVDPGDYHEVIRVIREGRANDGKAFRKSLAAKVFAHCSGYDRAITDYMNRAAAAASDDKTRTEPVAESMPPSLNIAWPRSQTLRYGENPHQVAAFYADPAFNSLTLAHCRQLQGKELSYNNFLDGEVALEMAREFDEPVAVILKHANPCGVGRGDSPAEAYQRALACDPVSAFGGIVGLNRAVDREAAEAMAELFLEVIIAPSFDPEAQEALSKKKNLRLLEAGELRPRSETMVYRGVAGGLLVQTSDFQPIQGEPFEVVTKIQPNEEDSDALRFAWKIVRWVKSNAIVYVTAQRTLGIGAGQMSRIDAAQFGLQKAGGKVQGAYLASDGFFPFRDVVDLAAEAGVKAIVQPGGSKRDAESIEAADEHGVIMVFTGMRHFRH